MSNVRYVNIIKVTSDPFVRVTNDFMSVCRQQPLCVSDEPSSPQQPPLLLTSNKYNITEL